MLPAFARHLSLLALATALCPAQERAREALVSIEKIWDRAESNAFTDLCAAGDKVYCVFREGTHHVHGLDGTIRVLASADRMNWTSVAHVAEEGVDLRDPKITRMPDGRLMLLAGGSRYRDRKLIDRATRVAFADAASGKFGAPTPVELDASARTGNDWLWRVTWHEGKGYGVVYHAAGDERRVLDLVTTEDGVRYALHARLQPPLTHEQARPSETTLRFLADGTMVALVRCDGANARGLVARAAAPYREFTWAKLDRRLGGPDFAVLGGDRLLVGSRAYPPPIAGPGRQTAQPWVEMFWLAPDGKTQVLCRLPSGGDCSYPGFARDGDRLLISYYSSHRGRASIFLATARLSALRED